MLRMASFRRPFFFVPGQLDPPPLPSEPSASRMNNFIEKSVDEWSVVPYLVALSGTFALAAWLMPTHIFPWSSFHAELAMAVAGILAGAAVLIKRRSRALDAHWLALLAACFAPVPLLQWLAGVVPFLGDAALASLYLIAFSMAIVFGAAAVAEWGQRRVLELFAWLIVTAALISTLIAMYQWQQLEFLNGLVTDQQRAARAYANFKQPNLFATFLLLGMLSAMTLFDVKRFGRGMLLAILAVLAMGLAMTQSRAGYLGVIVVVGLLVYKRDRLPGLRMRHVLVGISLVFAALPIWVLTLGLVGESSGRTGADIASGGNRLTHWSSMLHALSIHPWRGYGWSGTTAIQFEVASEFDATGEVLGYSHNLILDLLLWNGLPLGLLLISGLCLLLWRLLRDSVEFPVTLSVISVFAIVTHAMTEYPLYYTYFLLPTGWWLGAAFSAGKAPAAFKLPAWFVGMLLATISIVLMVVAADYFRLEEDVRAVRFEQAHIATDRPRLELSSPLVLTQLGAFTRFTRTKEHDGMTDNELNAMRDVVHRYPSGANVVRYAAALARNSRPNEARDELRRICKIEPQKTCGLMQILWKSLGDKVPAISQIAWPQ